MAETQGIRSLFEAAVPRDEVELIFEKFTNAQSLQLQTFRFLPRNQGSLKGLIFLLHGYGGHSAFEWLRAPRVGELHTEWEGSIPKMLTQAGYAVCTLDHQSHGLSQGARGLRCFFERFDDLAQEGLDFLEQVVLKDARLSGLPVFLFGLSMGGATAIRMAQMKPALFRAAVLYGPMVSLEEVKKQRILCCIKNGHLKPLVTCLDATIPTRGIAKAAKNEANPLMQKELDDDPMTYTGMVRVRVAKEFSDLTDGWMQGGLRSMAVPFITYHAVNDTFTDPQGSASLMEMAATTDKTYRRVGPGQDIDLTIWHVLSAEPGYEIILEDALTWIKERS